MPTPQRILIFGPSGSGKSTLARRMGERLGLPVVHLDRLSWKPGWVQSPDDEFRARVNAAVAEPAWIMDGNYSGTLDLRLPRTEAIVMLDLPRRIYFRRAVWRSIVNYGRTRSDLGPGNPEQFDPKFIFDWVWNYPTRSRAKTLGLLDGLRAEKQIIVLRSPKDVRAFVANLPATLSP